jgi:multiple sugar transport system substrate-binding protein
MLAVMAIATAIAVLVSCGGKEPPAKAGGGLSGTVSFMSWGDEAERLMYDKVLKSFEAANPGVKVNFIFTPDDYYTKLQTMIAGGTTPDVFYLAEGRIAQYARDGVCLDLAPYAAKYPELTDDFVDGLLRYGQVDGGLFAIPKDWQPIVMYINEDLFAAEGIPLPTSAWTVDDYRDIARRLTKTDGARVSQYGTALENYRADWMAFIGNYGGEWFKDGKSNWDSPAVIKGLEAMRAVIVDDKSSPSPSAVSSMGMSQTQLFETGKVAMFPTGRWAVPTYRETCAGFKWSAVEMPMGTTRLNPIITAGLACNAKAANPELSVALLRHILSDESLGLVTALGIGMPSYKRLLNEPGFVSEPPAKDPFVATGAYLDPKVQYECVATGKYAQFQDIISAQLDLVFNGSLGVAEAVRAIDAKANKDVFK